MATSNRSHEVRITLLENGHTEIIKKLDSQDSKLDQALASLSKQDVLGEIIKSLNNRMDRTDAELARIDRSHDGIYDRLRRVDKLDSDVKQIDKDIGKIETCINGKIETCINGEDGLKHEIGTLADSVRKLQTLIGGVSIAIGIIFGILELLRYFHLI